MSRCLAWIGALASGASVLVMALPTWRMEWVGADPTESLFTVESWGSPLLLGYGQVFPMVALAARFHAKCLAMRAALTLRGQVPGAVLAAAGIASSLLGELLFKGLSGVAVLAPLGLALALVALLAAGAAAARS